MSTATTAPATYACRINDVPMGEGRTVTVHASPIAIFHTAKGWYALDAACPHRAGPLADGIVCSGAVICPLHDRRFDLATGTPLSDGDGVQAHTVELREDRVYVTPAAQPRAHPTTPRA